MTDVSAIATVIADRTRARILDELMGGVPLPAGALAARVGVAPSTVSGHLAKLESAGIVTIAAVGRRREARLAGDHVADALEALGRLAPAGRPVGLRAVDRHTALRRARSCYDHLAGQLGVRLADTLVDRGALIVSDGVMLVPDGAEHVYRELGVDLESLRGARRPLVRTCSDWTERRPHVAGSLGAAILSSLLSRGWVQRHRDGRALNVTTAGAKALEATLGLSGGR